MIFMTILAESGMAGAPISPGKGTYSKQGDTQSLKLIIKIFRTYHLNHIHKKLL